MLDQHLQYELNLYKNFGLRDDYKTGLNIFNDIKIRPISVVKNATDKHLKLD
jgi:hypothetical protein